MAEKKQTVELDETAEIYDGYTWHRGDVINLTDADTDETKSYELCKAGSDNKDFGFGAVRIVETKDGIQQLVDDGYLDWPTIARFVMESDARHQQTEIRLLCTGDKKFTDAAYGKMFNKLSNEVLLSFRGKDKELRVYLKERWAKEVVGVTTDPQTIHWSVR